MKGVSDVSDWVYLVIKKEMVEDGYISSNKMEKKRKTDYQGRTEPYRLFTISCNTSI